MGRKRKIIEGEVQATPIEAITEDKPVVEPEIKADKPKTVKKSAPEKKAKTYSQEFKANKEPGNNDKSLAGIYTVTADSLNMRRGAGHSNGIMTVIPKGSTVVSYGGYEEVGGVKWLYVAYTIGEVLYEGYCCGTYLKK